MTRPKLGVHINSVRDDQEMIQWIGDVKPPIVKILDHNRGFLERAQVVSPDTLWIGRKWVDPDQSRLIAAKEDGADELFRRLQSLSTWDLIENWEGINEPGPHPTHNLMRFQLRLAQRLHEAGKKYVYGSWSVGCPSGSAEDPMADWKSTWITEVLKVASYIGVHEYCAPRMDSEFQIHSDDPDIQPEIGGYFTLRYRKWYPMLPVECQKPVIISECGIDSGAHGAWDPGAQGGWRKFTDPAGYIQQLDWYNQLLQEDDYVVGATIYCFGTADPTWDTYDCWHPESMRAALGQYIVSHQVVEKFFEERLTEAAQEEVIAFVPDNFFRRVALERGWEAISDEHDFEGFRYQVFVVKEEEVWWQKIIYSPIGDWESWQVIERLN